MRMAGIMHMELVGATLGHQDMGMILMWDYAHNVPNLIRARVTTVQRSTATRDNLMAFLIVGGS